MSDARILLCAPALNASESLAGLEMMRGLTLRGATKFVVTTGKFDTEKEARAFNVEAGYPAETALLQTLSRWAEVPEWPDARFRDGYDLFCLHQIMRQNEGFDIAVLLRDGSEIQARWASLLRALEGRFFVTGETAETGPNLLINLADRRARNFLDRAAQFYFTGRAYALETYSLDSALRLVVRAVELEADLDDVGKNTDLAGGMAAAHDNQAASR